jgi:hypothetical protein
MEDRKFCEYYHHHYHHHYFYLHNPLSSPLSLYDV